MDIKKTNKKVWIFLFLIFILALGLRVIVFSKQMNNMNLSYDPKNYWIMSHQMVDDGIYGYAYDIPSGEPNARVMPGYPLFLAAVYKIMGDKYLQITVVRLLQIIISSLSVLLGFLFVKKAFKNDLMALLTALFMAIYPTYVLSTVMLLTETLALFTMLLYFCLSLYAFESGKKGINFITGIVFGVHLMMRPALLPLFVFPFIFILISGAKSKESTESTKRSFTTLRSVQDDSNVTLRSVQDDSNVTLGSVQDDSNVTLGSVKESTGSTKRFFTTLRFVQDDSNSKNTVRNESKSQATVQKNRNNHINAQGMKIMSPKILATMFLFQLVGLGLVMAPWWVRNIVTLGTFILTAEGSGNPFLAGTYPYFQDYMLDVTDKMRGNNDLQMDLGIKRLINGLKTDFWLYIRWFTLGKTAHIFKEPYLKRLLINSEAPSKVIHFLTLIPGAIGSIIHAVKSIKSFWFYFYGLTILGLQLMFVPDPRFAYLILFFIIVGAAHLICYIIDLIKRRTNVSTLSS